MLRLSSCFSRKAFSLLFIFCLFSLGTLLSSQVESVYELHSPQRQKENPVKAPKEYPALYLDDRLESDLEMLLCGGFSPLQTFLNEGDYNSVVEDCHLSDGSLWPMPIVLPVESEKAETLNVGSRVALKDQNNNLLALLTIEEIYKPDLEKECQMVYGTTDRNHPYVEKVLGNPDVYYISGPLEKVSGPQHYDFNELRLTPEDTKAFFQQNGWTTVVGFQTRNPLHRCHVALTKYAALKASRNEEAKILLHPVVGVTQPGDVDYITRVKCYKKLLNYYPEGKVKLSLLPISMRMAGPREAMWHALIRKNYGCTHFVVGRDHAGPSTKTQEGHTFYGPYDAQEFLDKYSDELGIEIIQSKEIVYVEDFDEYLPVDFVPKDAKVKRISGTELRKRLRAKEDIPSWFSYPDVVAELQDYYAKSQGMCIYLTGLSGSGKSTIAHALSERLRETDPLGRPVVIVDGDEIRNYLSPDLGFSREDRSTNVKRIGYVAAQIVKTGGIALCANIAPYDDDRQKNRELISTYGQYVECYVNTPLEVCEDRDVKGLYKAAREGKIKQFTGISDPYEIPQNPEITVSGDEDIESTLNRLIQGLREQGVTL